MAREDLILTQHNAPTVTFTVTSDDTPLNLTGTTVNFYLKRRAEEPDADATLYSTTNGRITLHNQTTEPGVLDVGVLDADLADAGAYAYRLDVVTNAKPLTYSYGRATVLDV